VAYLSSIKRVAYSVTRKDDHRPIVLMQCGPVRYRVDARKQAAVRPFDHKVVFRSTAFASVEPAVGGPVRIQELYGLMAKDSARNDLIFDDVLLALETGRSPVILTERKDHLLCLADRLAKFAKNVIVFHGGMKAKAQKEAERALKGVPDSEERVSLATGRYLGEGFDDARLDTLFLTMPISWRGLLSQYAGRLHRLHPTKRDVMIYDYVDAREPMLLSMSITAARVSNVGLCGSVGRRDVIEGVACVASGTAELRKRDFSRVWKCSRRTRRRSLRLSQAEMRAR
jgi:superfamily II DNA or RNA helicase